MATITGTNNNDILLGTALADIIKGLNGNDEVHAGGGDDMIEGGAGADLLYGDEGNDTILGGSGMDTLRGGDGADTMDGGSDTDTLYGGDGNDNLKGGSGGASDFLYGEAGDDAMDGGSGSDVLDGGAGNDAMQGGSGNDTMNGGDGDDVMQGGSGNDIMQDSGTQVLSGVNLLTNGGFETPDIVDHSGAWQVYPGGIAGWTNNGGDGPELQDTSLGIIAADEGAQYLELDSNNNSAIYQDVNTGGTGDFQISFAYSPREGVPGGSNGVEVWWDGALLDTLTGDAEGWQTYTYDVQGGGATTRLEFRAVGTSDGLGGFIDDVSVQSVTSSSNDTLGGGSGNDTMDGGAGDDTLGGGSGNDKLTGGLGRDVLTGGDDLDTFIFHNLADSTTGALDLITDFTIGEDHIDLVGLGFTGIGAGAASGTTLGYAFSGGNTFITADGSNFSIELQGEHALTNGDFLFA